MSASDMFTTTGKCKMLHSDEGGHLHGWSMQEAGHDVYNLIDTFKTFYKGAGRNSFGKCPEFIACLKAAYESTLS